MFLEISKSEHLFLLNTSGGCFWNKPKYVSFFLPTDTTKTTVIVLLTVWALTFIIGIPEWSKRLH